ncbi:Dihydrolipoyllysine-residue succinyltransferase component of 2-oxoglutarate dehydrogenase complex [Trichinella spiralis]|uniref:Dihydrolipoyllysine-residue succinyltransferase component of 2-oxoglutarate dehydrogenase complex n=1 Tax=Trichinella spiralis TaxID=6334 RepID=A0ABR3KIM6_TRISP
MLLGERILGLFNTKAVVMLAMMPKSAIAVPQTEISFGHPNLQQKGVATPVVCEARRIDEAEFGQSIRFVARPKLRCISQNMLVDKAPTSRHWLLGGAFGGLLKLRLVSPPPVSSLFHC